MVDPLKPAWQNIQEIISNMTVEEYRARPKNMACHNLCEELTPPVGTKNLLGLGLNFCLKYTKPGNKYEETLDRLKKDIRRIYFFSDKPEDSSGYIKNIYIPSKWEFDPAEEI